MIDLQNRVFTDARAKGVCKVRSRAPLGKGAVTPATSLSSQAGAVPSSGRSPTHTGRQRMDNLVVIGIVVVVAIISTPSSSGATT